MKTYSIDLSKPFNQIITGYGYAIEINTPSDFSVIIGQNMQPVSALSLSTPVVGQFSQFQIENTNYPLYNGTAQIYVAEYTGETLPVISPVNVASVKPAITVDTIINPIDVNITSGTVSVSNITNPINVNTITNAVTVGSITNPVNVNIQTGTVAVSSITNPVNINTITKAVTVGAITNPVNVNINSTSTTIPVSGSVNANISNSYITVTGSVKSNITNATIDIGTVSGPISIATGTIITGTSTKNAPTVTFQNTTLYPAYQNASSYTVNMPNTTDLFTVQILFNYYVAGASPYSWASISWKMANGLIMYYWNLSFNTTNYMSGYKWFTSMGDGYVEFNIAGVSSITFEYYNNDDVSQTNGINVEVFIINDKTSTLSLQF